MDGIKLSNKGAPVLTVSGGSINRKKVYTTGYNDGYKVGETEGEQKGYLTGKEEGYAEGYNEGEKEGFIQGGREGEEIGYNRGYIKGKEDGVNEGHTAGYNEGYQAYYDWFWNQFQYNDTAINYTHRFYRWTNQDCYNPKYNIKHSLSAAESGTNTFAYLTNITDLKVDNICSSVTYLNMTCQYATVLKNARTFHVTESVRYYNTFYQCTSLEEIRFNGTIGQNGLSFAQSTKLSKDSIESVIEHLSSTTSGLTVTFSRTAVNKAFETSSGAADGSTSTEWTTLRNTKANWTISLA